MFDYRLFSRIKMVKIILVVLLQSGNNALHYPLNSNIRIAQCLCFVSAISVEDSDTLVFLIQSWFEPSSCNNIIFVPAAILQMLVVQLYRDHKTKNKVFDEISCYC